MAGRNPKYLSKDGTPIKQKCINEDVSYQAVLKYIGRGMSVDEAFEMAKITKIDPWRFLGKLRYGNESLSQYCKNHNLSYSKIYYRIYEKMMTVEEALNWKKNKSCR